VNDAVDSVGAAHADLEELTSLTRTDEHDEVVEYQDSGGVAVGVEDVVVVDAVLTGAGDDPGSTTSTYLDDCRGATDSPRRPHGTAVLGSAAGARVTSVSRIS
jgi:hypothetical protein